LARFFSKEITVVLPKYKEEEEGLALAIAQHLTIWVAKETGRF
jgi:hypothetical protein